MVDLDFLNKVDRVLASQPEMRTPVEVKVGKNTYPTSSVAAAREEIASWGKGRQEALAKYICSRKRLTNWGLLESDYCLRKINEPIKKDGYRCRTHQIQIVEQVYQIPNPK